MWASRLTCDELLLTQCWPEPEGADSTERPSLSIAWPSTSTAWPGAPPKSTRVAQVNTVKVSKICETCFLPETDWTCLSRTLSFGSLDLVDAASGL